MANKIINFITKLLDNSQQEFLPNSATNTRTIVFDGNKRIDRIVYPDGRIIKQM